MLSIRANHFFITLILILAFALLSGSESSAEEILVVEDSKEGTQSLHTDLAFLASENYVYSVSKRLETIRTAPSAISVITADHLNLIDARYLPQVLRLFPGIDVIQITRSEFTVGIRGFSSSANFRPRDILVLEDGRTVYDDFSGNVEWENLDIFPQDAAKIEVILGAGSAIHGANAARGVINILTKPPAAISTFESDTSFVEHGFRERLAGSYLKGSYAWKITGGYDQVDLWNRFEEPSLEDDLGAKTWRFNTRLTKALSGNAELRLGAGTNAGPILQHATSGFLLESQQSTNHIQAEYESPYLLVRSFWNYRHLENYGPLSGSLLTERTQNLYDLEVVRRFERVGRNLLLLGGDLRYTTVTSRSINGEIGQFTGGFFIDDQYNITDHLLARLAGRLDYHQEAGYQFSPRVGVACEFRPQQTVKASVNVGYRSPTISNNFFDIFIGGTSLKGNQELSPEKSIWYEAGYLGQSIPGLTYGIDLFYVTTEELIESIVSADETLTTFENSDSRIRGSGGEIWGQVEVTSSIRVLANYGYAQYRQESSDVEGTAPHKVNIGILFSHLRRFSGAVTYHFINRTRLPFVAGEFQENPSKVDSYYLLNAFLSYQFTKNLSIRTAIFNLTDRRHREIPPVGEELSREISFTLSYNM